MKASKASFALVEHSSGSIETVHGSLKSVKTGEGALGLSCSTASTVVYKCRCFIEDRHLGLWAFPSPYRFPECLNL